MNNWGLIGNGFVADRHIKAIRHIGHDLVAVADNDLSRLSGLSPFIRCYINWENMLEDVDISHIAICAPSHLHANIALACQDKQVLCEKPLGLHENELIGLNGNVGMVMQLRYLPEIQALKNKIDSGHKLSETRQGQIAEIIIHVNRDKKNRQSWKSDVSKSGGDFFNLGIHYFDLLIWLFGGIVNGHSFMDSPHGGSIKFNKGTVLWEIRTDMPKDKQKRELIVDGQTINLMQDYQPLYNKLYKDFISGKKIGVKEAAYSIEVTRTLT